MLKKRGWVGIEMEQTEDGMLAITRVIADSPAEKAGFQAGDVLTSVNGLAYAQADEAKRKAVWQEMLPGKKMSYVVDRGGKSLDVEVVLASIPETVMAQWIGQHMLMAHLDHSEELPASP